MNENITTIGEMIESLGKNNANLAKPVPVDGLAPMIFTCSFSDEKVDREEFAALPFGCPVDLIEFWSFSRSARLFEDREYGQWGLEFLSPRQAVEETNLLQSRREQDFLPGIS